MKTRIWLAALLIAAGAFGSHHTSPVLKAARDTGQDASTLDDQVDLAVTVYNSDIALVRDVRDLQLPRGTFDLRFMDIAATVNPATVHLRSLTEPSRVNVVEQNYEYDLLEPDKLLRKYVGRDVILVRRRSENGQTREEEVKARLLSDNNAPVWQIGNEIVTGMNADHIKFPELPGNLYTHPTLIWTLDNTGGAKPRVEASYLATPTMCSPSRATTRRPTSTAGSRSLTAAARPSERPGSSWSPAISTASVRSFPAWR
jgi:hypothetical protein